jgi:hypothetical protein
MPKRKYKDVLDLVQYATKGSDIYGLVERTAYFLSRHPKKQGLSPDYYWIIAQARVANNLQFGLGGVEWIPTNCHDDLANEADRISKTVQALRSKGQQVSDDPFSNWMVAMDNIAISLAEP